MAMNASNREAGPYRRIKQVPYHSSNRQEFRQRFHSKQKESAKFSRGGGSLLEDLRKTAKKKEMGYGSDSFGECGGLGWQGHGFLRIGRLDQPGKGVQTTHKLAPW